jgi:hypothetical protein
LEEAVTKFDDNIKLYETFRNYARHEDNLINNRVMWLLSIHGFLYATYGLTVQKRLEIVEKISLNVSTMLDAPAKIAAYKFDNNLSASLGSIELFLILISVIGLFISILAQRSIKAAKISVLNLQKIFLLNDIKVFEGHFDRRGRDVGSVVCLEDRGSAVYLPNIAGGGKNYLIDVGHSASTTIPLLLACSWVVALTFQLLIGVPYISYYMSGVISSIRLYDWPALFSSTRIMS